MCEQTEIAYLPNEIVWVKLGPVWWPGEVQDYDSLPEEITGDLRKQPIAVVKFFQEDSYEYIKNLNHIYRYNCLKKNEFIKKGLDLCRSSHTRNVPSNMKMFPADIVTAEKRTGGNPGILESELFLPEEKKSYTELFGTPKKVSGNKEGGGTAKRGRPPASEGKSKVSTPISSGTPSHRSITHPRFVGKSRSNTPDYESRVRQQPPPDGDISPTNLYRCHACDFTTKRLNVIVMHNKSHTGTNVDFSVKDSNITVKKHTPRIKSSSTPKTKPTGEATKRKLVTESPSAPKKANISPAAPKKEKPSVKNNVAVDQEPKPVAKKRGPKPTKAEKITKVLKENEAIRENLLKDWDDEDESGEEEEKSKQFDEKSLSESMSFNDGGNDGIDGEGESKADNSANGETDKISEEKSKSCFDFDDSEDSPPKNPIPFSRKLSTAISDGPSIPAAEDKEDKEVEEFQKKIDDLLCETSVPKLPEGFKLLATVSEKLINEPTKLAVADSEPESNKFEQESFVSLEVNKSPTPLSSNTLINDAISNVKEEPSKEAENEPIIKTEAYNDATDDCQDAVNSTEEALKSYPSSSESFTIDYNPQPLKQQRRSNCIDSNPISPATIADSSHWTVPQGISAPTESSAATSSAPFVTTETPMDIVTETVEMKPAVGNASEETNEELKEITPESNVITSESLSSDTKSESHEVCSTSVSSEVMSGKSLVISPNSSSLTHTGEIQTSSRSGGSAGRRGRPSGSRMIIAKPASSCPPPILVRRRSNPKRLEEATAPTSVYQKIERGSRFTPKAQKETVSEDEVTNSQPASISDFNLTPTNSVEPAESTELVESLNVVPEPVLEENFVVGGELTISAEETMRKDLDLVPTSTNNDLNFDINSLPIIIDNSEYNSCSSEYEKVETVPIVPDSVPVESPQSVASLKVERKAMKPKTSSSFLEKALINCDGNSSTSNVVTTSKKIPLLAKSEKGSTSKVLMPMQTAAGTSGKVRTVKIPGSKFFSQNAKSSNQFLILKTSTGQQILKSSQLLQQPDGKMLIVTSNQSQRSGLIVKSIAKGEQISSSKISTSRIITTKGVVCSSASNIESASGSKSTASLLSKASGENSAKNKTPAGPSLIGAKPKILGKVSNSSNVVFSSAGNLSAKNVVLSAKQAGSKVIITSKSGSGPGTKFVMHSSPTKVVLPASMRQKFIGSSTSPSNIIVQSSRLGTPSTVAVQVSSTNKVLVSQASSSTPVASAPKVIRVQKQGPNILQKQQRRSGMKTVTVATSSKVVPAAVSSGAASGSLTMTPADSVILPSQSSSVNVVPNSPCAGTQPVMYVAVDNNTYQPVDSSMLSYDASQQPAQTYYINSGSTNLENIFLTVDDKGNYNLAQPSSSQLFTSDVATPTQDILAKALADTQVLQTEASIADAATGRVAYIESLPYPAPSLSSNVLETSLTLNQPIMTPLEVPSSATPVSSNFNLIASSQSSDNAKSTQEAFITQIPAGIASSNIAFQIVDQHLVAAPPAGLNPVTSTVSTDISNTSIDEDLIKINKPLKPSKGNLIKSEDMSCDEPDSFLAETQPENEVNIESSSYIISESSSVVDSLGPPIYVKDNSSQILPAPLSSDGGDQTQMVVMNVQTEAVNDNCNSFKEEVVIENDFISQSEVVNGVDAICENSVSASKITKDLGVSCQEPEGNSNQVLSAPSGQPLCEG